MKLFPPVPNAVFAHAVLAAAGLLTLGLLTAGCGTGPAGSVGSVPTGGSTSSGTAAPSASGSAPSSPGGQQSAGPASPTPTPTGQTSLQAWFTRGGKLFVTERSVPATTGVAKAAIGAVLAGPSAAERAAGMGSQVPAGTALLGVRISGGIATVDLSSAFVSSAGAGSMPARIAQLVYTATQFPTVHGVRFAINGQSTTVLGGVPVQDPQTRAMHAGFLPAITVQSPVIGQQVSSPVTVAGTADVFEATVSIRVLDAAGHEVARTFTTATCGTGCRGDYSVTVTYSVPRTQRGVVEVFESSAKNGRPINVQRIPVTLTA